jgi:hypothetical protein
LNGLAETCRGWEYRREAFKTTMLRRSPWTSGHRPLSACAPTVRLYPVRSTRGSVQRPTVGRIRVSPQHRMRRPVETARRHPPPRCHSAGVVIFSSGAPCQRGRAGDGTGDSGSAPRLLKSDLPSRSPEDVARVPDGGRPGGVEQTGVPARPCRASRAGCSRARISPRRDEFGNRIAD